ncbi:MAG: glycosyltransferase family 2 protein [Eubacterium sp.]
MTQDDLISVIIPVYKVEKYLDRCVESIVNQTYKNLEIILVDDGSPDNCPALCDEWAEKDRRIKVIHKENGGVSSARNAGVEGAKGDYIAFVDSDDYIEQGAYEFMINSAVKDDSDILVCSYFADNTDDENTDNALWDVSQSDALSKIACGDYKYGVLWNKLYKKSVAENIMMPDLVCCEDLVYNYFAFKNAKKIKESNAKYYHYMSNDESTVHGSFGIGAFDAVKSKEIILKNEQGTSLEKYAVKGLINSCFVVLSGVIQSGKCLDKYDFLRDIILSYKKEIFNSNLYSNKERIKVFVLQISKKFYNYFIKRSNM